MHILYEEDGGFKAGKLLSESDSSVQVEAASGKRSKIRNNSVVLRFERPSAEQLIPEAQALAETFELQFLWECAPQDEFDIAALAAEYFGHAPSAIEYTALLLRVHGAPAYFHRRGKGRYRPAPPEVLQAAIAALERKQRQAEQVEAWAQAMANGQLPPEIARLADTLLIRPDKNQNTAAARALFPPLSDDVDSAFGDGTDLVLVWGEGYDFANIPPQAKIIFLNSYLAPENGHADVFLPISTQTERAGHYTNFQGVVSRFEPCFPKGEAVLDAEALFKALEAPPRGHT